MVFASLVFLYAFLPASLLLYYACRTTRARNRLLVLLSLAFYAWGEPTWVVLLAGTAAFDYAAARFIEHHQGTGRARAGLIAAIAVNLGILVLFKYSGFLCRTVNQALGLSLAAPALGLPIGISFYTFQAVSYLIDVHRGQVKAQRSWVDFQMYLSLFPQLTAGPIVRYRQIAAEIGQREAGAADISRGVTRFCVGLFKKAAVANIAGQLARQYLDADFSSLSVGGGWFGIILFTLQVYFDFSGYSDMAIGLARMFGFHYPENFDYPYLARSATEFWRRWHMTLSGFFRDYVFLPLAYATSRRLPEGKVLFLRSDVMAYSIGLAVTWLLTGLWHGASWNFVLWGLYYGCLIGIERLFLGRLLRRLPGAAGHLYLMAAVVMGWCLFYFTDPARLRQFLGLLFGLSGSPLWDFELELVIKNQLFWLIGSMLLCLPVWPAAEALIARHPHCQAIGKYGMVAFNLALLAVSTALLVGKSFNPFLYFRF